ncbi:MAG: cation diffusion facilitator family transporter [Lachnospiraceae bacterium]
MVEWLAKHVIKDSENISDGKVRGQYGTLCSIMGIVFNVFLFAVKYLAGSLSGSIAIVADSFNSLSDAGSSIITLTGFKLAEKKPDPDHPFGHGRMEYLSGLVVAFLVLLMGVELLKGAVNKILHPEPVEGGTVVLVILVVSILVKCYMAFYNNRIGKKINSSAMKATSTDSLSDAVSTFVVLLCTVAAQYTSVNLDGWCGLLVSALVLYAGIGAVKETMDPLLGQPPEQEFVDSIEQIVMAHEQIIGIHDLVVHDYGPGRLMISLHAEVPGDSDIFEVHDLIDNVEQELDKKLGCEATIHMDPIAVGDEQTKQLKRVVTDIIKDIDENLTLHDFRIVTGPTHTNLVFDVVKPAGFQMENARLTGIIQERVTAYDKRCFTVIKVDQAYVK